MQLNTIVKGNARMTQYELLDTPRRQHAYSKRLTVCTTRHMRHRASSLLWLRQQQRQQRGVRVDGFDTSTVHYFPQQFYHPASAPADLTAVKWQLKTN